MVHVSVTVKTVLMDVPPVYLDGADLQQITAKNVGFTYKIYQTYNIVYVDKYYGLNICVYV